MAYNIGEAYLQIVPSFNGVAEAINREAAKWGLSAGRAFADPFNREVQRQTNNAPLGPSAATSTRQGQSSGGKFADGFRAKVETALRALPDVEINADSTDAQVKVARLREELAELSRQRVGIDIDEGEAQAQLDRIRGDLERLSRSSASPSVKADTAGAAAALARTQAQVDTLSHSSANIGVNVDTGPALAGIGIIAKALLGLSAGAVITPVLGGLGALLGPLAAAGLGGGGVLGASLPGLSNVKNVLSAQSSASTGSAGQSATAQAAAQVNAANQIKAAKLSLADTERRVANDNVTSAQAVVTAERGVVTAQRASLAAQQALSAAREAASRALQDSAFSVKDAQLSLQADQLAVTQAQQNLDSVNASGASTTLQKQQAVLALAQAQQALVEQQVTAKRATEDNTKAQAAGVAGSVQVVSAQNAARQATAGVSQAEQGLANARRARTLQQANDASELVRAHQAVAAAQLAAAQAADKQSSASANLGAAMAKLTPQEVALLNATKQFKSAFTDFGDSLEPVTLPLFTEGLKILTGLLPKLEPLIRATAGALADVEASFAKAVNGGGAAKFLDTLTKLAGPSIKGLASIFGNLGGVIAHLIESFAPLSGEVLGGLDRITGSLAKAAESPGLKAFVATIMQIGPLFDETLGNVGGLLGKLVGALAPLAGPVLSVVNTLAKALQGVVTGVGPAIADLFTKLAPAINTLIDALGPFLTQLVDVLAPILGQIATALGPVLAQAVAALTPVLKPLATFLGDVVLALAPILPLIAQLIGSLLPPFDRFLAAIVTALQPVISALVVALAPALGQIIDAFGQLLTALTPVFPIFAQLLLDLVPLIPPLAQLIVQIIKLAVDLLPIFIPLLKLISPVLQVLVAVVNFVVNVLTDLVRIIGDVIGWFVHFNSTVKTVTSAVSSAWSHTWSALKTAWKDVSGFLTDAWDKFAGTAKKAWDKVAGAVSGAFGAIKGAMSDVWTDVEKVFASGVNFVTQKILNPLIGILNDVLGIFGISIGKIGKITVGSSSGNSNPGNGSARGQGHKGFKVGGVLPGYSPGVDNIALPSYLFSGGEGILVPEATRALGGADGIHAINSMFSARLSPPNHFSGGGTLPIDPRTGKPFKFSGGIGFGGTIDYGGLGDVIDKIKDAIRRGAADVAIAGLKTAELPIKKLIGSGGSDFAKKLAGGVFSKLNSEVYDFIRGHTATVSNGITGGMLPTGSHASLIDQALADAGLPRTAGNESAVNTIVSYESGWNPAAINLTDSNARAGHPSQGLMQTIPSTFEAYRLASMPNIITDPLANLVAGIRYAVSTYGSLENVPGVLGVANGTGYVGYDAGGLLPTGRSMVYNGTGQAELIAPQKTFEQVINNTRNRAQNGPLVEQNVYPQAGQSEHAIASIASSQLLFSLKGAGVVS